MVVEDYLEGVDKFLAFWGDYSELAFEHKPPIRGWESDYLNQSWSSVSLMEDKDDDFYDQIYQESEQRRKKDTRSQVEKEWLYMDYVAKQQLAAKVKRQRLVVGI
jgi:hypothetical protein